MNNTEVNTSDLKVFTNHIYELEKGVRRMVLYTTHGRNRDFVVRRLDNRNISYVEQPVGNGRINIFFGSDECIDAVRLLLSRPLYELTPEEDFILGAMLGYDIPEGNGLKGFFAGWSDSKWDITAGTFYEQFGSRD